MAVETNENEATLVVPDGRRAFERVELAHELRQPRRTAFERRNRRWELTIPRPEADRMEYLLEVERRDGGTELLPDPTNPLRAPGPFGDKSVLEFPEYHEPEWVHDEESPAGDVREIALESRRLRTTINGLLWSPADTDGGEIAPEARPLRPTITGLLGPPADRDPAEPMPLLVVHDGPEYAEY